MVLLISFFLTNKQENMKQSTLFWVKTLDFLSGKKRSYTHGKIEH